MADIITVGIPGSIGGLITSGLLGQTGSDVVPDVVGLTPAEAAIILVDAGFVPVEEFAYSDTVPEDEIISQDPTAGALGNPGDPVIFVVSLGEFGDRSALITKGPVHQLLQNIVYPLPMRATPYRSTSALEFSLDGTNWYAVPASGIVNASFVRCTTTDAAFICKLR